MSNELFDADEMVRNVDTGDMEYYSNHFRDLGQRTADKIVDSMLEAAMKISQSGAKAVNFDASRAELEQTDKYMEIVFDLANEFLEGMESAWPNSIIN